MFQWVRFAIVLPEKVRSQSFHSQSYITRFKALKTIGSDLSPKIIMVGFEKCAAMNVITSEFPESKLKGCFFHLTQ